MSQGQSAAALHLDGVMLPSGERTGVWIVDGAVTFTPVPGATTIASDVWILPGLVDAHCHIGLGSDGAVAPAVAEQQAITDRNAGTLLIRDA